MIRAAPAPMLPGESLGHYRRTDSAEKSRRADRAWAEAQAARMPNSWAGRLLTRWVERYRIEPAAANLDHLQRCRAIDAAHRAGVNADAGDAELCEVARQSAADMGRRLDQRARITAGRVGDPVSPWSTDWRERVGLLAQLDEALHWLGLRGIVLQARGSIAALLRRVRCDRWWRRVLRRMHATAVESTARAIGLVHRRAGCYVSDESARRRQAQNARNARALESVEAVNERAQRYTLAELAAKGPANRAIRRHELMTRIAGFELIARELDHVAMFVTVTCPSRMHAQRTKPGTRWGVEPNPSHDGTRPDEAQRHLASCWARFRAAAAREGLGEYGFRIAEPNHDGTPHWHAILFVPQQTAKGHDGEARGLALLRRYFLEQHDPDERGAQQHRVTVERIDWTRGSAAGYVAKYVAKNIDGMHVGTDLEGNPALESSARVDAWASTWRIRQFQQVGGAPVGVWRELRRTHPEQGQHSLQLAQALAAVNGAAWQAQQQQSEAVERYTAASGWRDYLRAQGGHRVRRRDQRIRVLREQTGEVGRYGEPMAPAVVGLRIAETIIERRPAFGIVPATTAVRRVVEQVESERSTWVIVSKGCEPPQGAQARGEAARPWSPVINCTKHPEPLFAPTVRRRSKVGRWADWSKVRTGGRAATGVT